MFAAVKRTTCMGCRFASVRRWGKRPTAGPVFREEVMPEAAMAAAVPFADYRNGGMLEKGGRRLFHVHGDSMPALRHPRNVRSWPGARSRPWACHCVMHPNNPHIPTSHRQMYGFCVAESPAPIRSWWLWRVLPDALLRATKESCVHFAPVAMDACASRFGD